MESYDNKQAKPKKKVTNRDVAKFAGVSVATVSYVVNGREDQHISEETKMKVLHAINFLGYIPNPHAVGLNTPQLRTIVLRSGSAASPLAESELIYFMHSLEDACREQDFRLLYSIDKDAERLTANACICFDMPDEEFRALSRANFIPVIAVDCLVNDPIFYQITVDYGKVRAAAEKHFGGSGFTYCCIEPQNVPLREEILRHFARVETVTSFKELRPLLSGRENIALTQPALACLLQAYGRENVFFFSEHLAPRAQITLERIRAAIDRTPLSDPEHFIKV